MKPTVDKRDAAQPFPITVVTALFVIFPPDEIPHEIPPVHIAELETDHIIEVLSQAGWLDLKIVPESIQETDILLLVDLSRFQALPELSGCSPELGVVFGQSEIQRSKIPHIVLSVLIAPHPGKKADVVGIRTGECLLVIIHHNIFSQCLVPLVFGFVVPVGSGTGEAI